MTGPKAAHWFLTGRDSEPDIVVLWICSSCRCSVANKQIFPGHFRPVLLTHRISCSQAASTRQVCSRQTALAGFVMLAHAGHQLAACSRMFGQVQARKLPRYFYTLLRAAVISMVVQTSLPLHISNLIGPFFGLQGSCTAHTVIVGAVQRTLAAACLLLLKHTAALACLHQKSRLTCCAQLAAAPFLPAFPSTSRENCCAEHTAQLSMRFPCASSCKPSRRPYAERAAQPGASSSPSPMRPRLALRELKCPPTCSSPSPRRAPC